MTTEEAIAALKAANPKLSYTVTKDHRYRWGQLSGVAQECVEHYVNIHHGDDGADRHKSQTFGPHETLSFLVEQAINFVKGA